jgi:transposase-like protein
MKKGVASVDSSFERMAVAEYRELGNLSLVARKYKVARTTLMRWIKRYEGQELNEPIKPTTAQEAAAVRLIESASQATVRAIEAEAATRQEFLRAQFPALCEAITENLNAITSRLKDRPETIPFRDLASSLASLTAMAKEFLPQDDDQGKVQINLLQQTLNR